MIYPVFGKYEKALEEAKKAVEFDPDFPIGYYQLAFNYTYLGPLGGRRERPSASRRAQIGNP